MSNVLELNISGNRDPRAREFRSQIDKSRELHEGLPYEAVLNVIQKTIEHVRAGKMPTGGEAFCNSWESRLQTVRNARDQGSVYTPEMIDQLLDVANSMSSAFYVWDSMLDTDFSPTFAREVTPLLAALAPSNVARIEDVIKPVFGEKFGHEAQGTPEEDGVPPGTSFEIVRPTSSHK